MSSYLSSILTTTTSRYNSLRRTLLSDETDGDSEDDTHVSRVLRAYYTEKGRPFPPWLPPDPRAPQRPTQTPFISMSGRSALQAGGVAGGRSGGGLSDLWDSPKQDQSSQESLSLRRGGQQGRAAAGMGRAGRQYGSEGGGDGLQQSQTQQAPSLGPRSISYQSSQSQSATAPTTDRPYNPSPPPANSSGISSQERLKARLLGTSRFSGARQSPMSSPDMDAQSSRDTTDRRNRVGGGGSSGSYHTQESGYSDHGGDGGQSGLSGLPAQPTGGGSAYKRRGTQYSDGRYQSRY